MYEYSKGMSVLVVRGRKEDKERWKEGKKGGSSLP